MTLHKPHSQFQQLASIQAKMEHAKVTTLSHNHSVNGTLEGSYLMQKMIMMTAAVTVVQNRLNGDLMPPRS
jgi:hypothetical protein